MSNYEDIFYILNQVYESEMFEFENPALKPYIENLKENCGELISDDFTLKKLLKESLRFIQCIVWQMLSVEPDTTEQFNVINDFYNNQDYKHVNLLTLNHDTLIENHLVKSKLDFR
ncbi:MAG: hypothetical protein U5Q03_04180 [Bacteroidota bacterium]|nr:hypothetical protein [Bacteroidota bacterium]